jgi:hypothetical protein
MGEIVSYGLALYILHRKTGYMGVRHRMAFSGGKATIVIAVDID